MGRKTQKNKLTTPELLAQCNQSNMRLKDDFLLYLRSMQRSPETIVQYDSDLKITMVYILQHCNNKDFHKLTKRDIVALQNWLINENGNSPARVRRLKSTLSSLSNFIETILSDDEDEYKDYRPIVRKIENPVNTPVREKTVLSEDQVQFLLDTLCANGQFEKACAIALGAYSGRRKAELLRFKVSDFDDSNIVYGSLYRTPRKIKTKGRGVVGKPLTCYTLAKPFKPYFDQWMAQREERGVESEWLFPDPDDQTQHRSPTIFTSWSETCSRILGVPFYPHCLRHSFTTGLMRAGLPAEIVKEVVGWESVDMVGVYNDASAEEELGKYFSDGGVVAPTHKSLADL